MFTARPVGSRRSLLARAALVVALTAGAATALVPTAHPAAPAACQGSAAKGHVGVSPGAGIIGLNDSDLTRELTAVRDAGVKLVRVDVDWSVIEPQRGTQNWGPLDRVVNAITGLGMCPTGVVAYTPRWAQNNADNPTDSHFRPADPQTFATFAKSAATHYQNTIGVWEIWNEPNLNIFYKPAPDTAGYGRLLAAASAAIRTLSPAPAVISGGLAPAVENGSDIAPLTFLKALYAANLKNSFDAVAVHPYTFPALPNDPSTRSYSTFQRMWDMHDFMTANGDGGKLLWMTESGAPTGTNPVAVSEDVQAQTVQILLASARDTAWVGPAFIYNIRDTGTNAFDIEQNFGLLRNDFTPKKAYQTVKDFTAASTPPPTSTPPTSTPPTSTPPSSTPPSSTPPTSTPPTSTPASSTPPTTPPAAPMFGSS